MKKRTIIIISLLVIAAIAIIFLCTDYRSQKDVPSIIEFTALLPLTGPLSQIGDDERTGMTLAIEDLATEKKQKISFVFNDSQGKGAASVSAVQKEWNINNRRFFITTTTGPTLSTLPIFDGYQENKVVITQTMYPEVTKNHPYAFRLFPSSSQEAMMLADYVINTANKKVAILHINNEWGQESVRIFRERLTQKGGEIVMSETHSFADKDFRIILLKMAASKPDMLLVYTYPEYYPPILDQMKSAGLTQPILAYTGFATADMQNKVAGDILARTIFPAPRYFYDSESKEVIQFNKRVRSAGHEPNFDIATFYDMTMILNRAAMASSDMSPESFSSALLSTLPYHGVTGDIIMDENRDVTVEFALAKWVDGSIELIKP